MFQRLIPADSQALYTMAAFAVATSIFISFAWRALRMRRPQLDQLANLPFETATPPAPLHARPDSSA
jgi:hypothetical protein